MKKSKIIWLTLILIILLGVFLYFLISYLHFQQCDVLCIALAEDGCGGGCVEVCE